MKKNICKAMLLWTALVGLILSLPLNAWALEPRLLWKKEFKDAVKSVDLAKETGEVILSIAESYQVILYDKNGKERFHWGPRVDRGGTGVSISKDGKYFVFTSGYQLQYAEKKGVADWDDDRIHYYSSQTKKELWNIKQAEGHATLAPDGRTMIVQFGDSDDFELYNFSGQAIAKGLLGVDFAFSPDGGYFAVNDLHRNLLLLFKSDGTKLWERNAHGEIASISEGASYISTDPYFLAYSASDSLNSNLGVVLDKNGNKILEGFGIVSGNGVKVAMFLPDKISFLSLPSKEILTEIPIKIKKPVVPSHSFAAFSHDGRYFAVQSDSAIFIFDLVDNIRKDIIIPGLVDSIRISLTRDGKYLLVSPTESKFDKIIYYYQVY